jgi:glucan biosynthesis protein C
MQSTQATPFSTSERFYGLDAARAIALFIGIFHHGIESFVSYCKWDWITQDSQTSLSLDILFYISHIFRMQAFFLMSGFFAHLLFIKMGAWGFALNRAKRLLLPLILFWPLLYAGLYNLWVWGIRYLTHCSYEEAVSKLPNYMVWSKGLPFMHLWFLYFLILFCFCTIVMRPIVVSLIDRNSTLRNAVDKVLMYCMRHWWGGLVLGIIMLPAMLGMKDWLGVDTSSSGLMPRPAPFILYGLYFTLGWFIYRQSRLLKNIAHFRLINLVASAILVVSLIALNLILGNPAPEDETAILLLINTVYSFASITTVFAFIGYMMTLFSTQNTTVRYLSDASYWGYLIHLPLIGFFQIIIAPYDWFWGFKLLLILLPSVVIMMVTYRYAVRNTIIGVLLNGEKKSTRYGTQLNQPTGSL